MTPADKTCVSCGRTIQWRRKWERSWDEVRYCSAACRRRGVSPDDTALEERILAAVSARRSVPIADIGSDEPTRRAARRLVERGRIEIVQAGHVVDPSTARGPFEVRRRR